MKARTASIQETTVSEHPSTGHWQLQTIVSDLRSAREQWRTRNGRSSGEQGGRELPSREAIRRICNSVGYVEVPDPTTGKIARLVLTGGSTGANQLAPRRDPLPPQPQVPQIQQIEPPPPPEEPQTDGGEGDNGG